jgi:hypothetical protein
MRCGDVTRTLRGNDAFEPKRLRRAVFQELVRLWPIQDLQNGRQRCSGAAELD